MSAHGQGSLSHSPRNVPAGAPFPAGSANNGLSVDPVSGRIVLGQNAGEAGNPAGLLSAREIPANGFPTYWIDPTGFEITSITTQQVAINRANTNSQAILAGEGDVRLLGTSNIFGHGGRAIFEDSFIANVDYILENFQDVWQFKDGGNGLWQIIDAQNLLIRIGDLTPIGNGVELSIDDINELITGRTTAGRMLSADQLGNTYGLGDLDAVNNGLRLNLDDSLTVAIIQSTLGRFLNIDGAGSIFQFGDIDAAVSGSTLKINDALQILSYDDSIGRMLSLDRISGSYQIGDIFGAVNSSKIVVDDVVKQITAFVGGAGALLLDNVTALYQMGDIGGTLNNTFISIDDAATTILANATGGFLTTDPGSGAGAWKLGKVIAGAVVVDAANYVEVDIDGAIVKLLKAA